MSCRLPLAVRVEETQWAVGFPGLAPPFPASCAFRSTLALLSSPPSQTPPCRFPAAGSSNRTPRLSPGMHNAGWQQG